MHYNINTYTDDLEASQLVAETIDQSFKMVCSTMGPNAKLILIMERNQSVLTKDGVRVAKALDFNEPRKNAIAKLITSAAIKTDEMVGDGTTTTVFMVNGLYNKFKDTLNFAGVDYIGKLVKLTKKYLGEMITEVTPHDEKFVRMVYTTANYQSDIADTIITLFRDYRSPKITLKRSNGHPEDIIDVYSDIVFEGQYATPHLQPPTVKHRAQLDKSYTLLFDGMVQSITQDVAKNIVSKIVEHEKPFLLVARHFEPEAINMLISINKAINKSLGHSENAQKLYVIPFTLHIGGTAGGNVMKDLGRLLNVSVFSGSIDTGVIESSTSTVTEHVTVNMNAISFSKENIVIKERAESILNELEPLFNDMTITERMNILGKLLQSRIGRLRAENVTITVSGMTDAEISERYYLFEDAYRVAGTSLRFGVIPGIGYGFNQVAEKLYRTIVLPLYEKREHGELSYKERSALDLTEMFCEVLVSQYKYLTGMNYTIGDDNDYLDLVRGETFDIPEFVFDNGCAGMCAIEAAWSVVKGLGRTGGILGKPNHSSNN